MRSKVLSESSKQEIKQMFHRIDIQDRIYGWGSCDEKIRRDILNHLEVLLGPVLNIDKIDVRIMADPQPILDSDYEYEYWVETIGTCHYTRYQYKDVTILLSDCKVWEHANRVYWSRPKYRWWHWAKSDQKWYAHIYKTGADPFDGQDDRGVYYWYNNIATTSAYAWSIDWSGRCKGPKFNGIRSALEMMGIVKSKTHQVDWQILPPGEKPQISRDGSITRSSTKNNQRAERLTFLEILNPVRWWRGIPLKGSREYYAAEFTDNIIAECPENGNAIYYHPNNEGWQAAFQGSKTEALAAGASKIEHRGDWQKRINALVE